MRGRTWPAPAAAKAEEQPGEVLSAAMVADFDAGVAAFRDAALAGGLVRRIGEPSGGSPGDPDDHQPGVRSEILHRVQGRRGLHGKARRGARTSSALLATERR